MFKIINDGVAEKMNNAKVNNGCYSKTLESSGSFKTLLLRFFSYCIFLKAFWSITLLPFYLLVWSCIVVFFAAVIQLHVESVLHLVFRVRDAIFGKVEQKRVKGDISSVKIAFSALFQDQCQDITQFFFKKLIRNFLMRHPALVQ